jgi:hypothetical protein
LFGFAAPAYVSEVLAANPAIYYPLIEDAAGTGIAERVRAAQGTYSGVTLGEAGGSAGPGGVGWAPLWDGVNDCADLTAGLGAWLDGAEGTLLVWARVADAGAWSDGALRRIVNVYADVNNRIFIHKDTAAGTLKLTYRAGGTASAVSVGGVSETGWLCLALTWDRAAGASGEVRAYLTGLGTWAGAVAYATAGAGDLTPTAVWDGWLAHVVLWRRALGPDEVAALATTGGGL